MEDGRPFRRLIDAFGLPRKGKSPESAGQPASREAIGEARGHARLDWATVASAMCDFPEAVGISLRPVV
jgi:hypothetical protein